MKRSKFRTEKLKEQVVNGPVRDVVIAISVIALTDNIFEGKASLTCNDKLQENMLREFQLRLRHFVVPKVVISGS